jgi:hypothetical protein
MKDEIEKILGRALNDKIEAVWNVEDGKVSLESATQDIMALIKRAVPEKKDPKGTPPYMTTDGKRSEKEQLITAAQNAIIDTINTNLGVDDE